MDLEKEILMEEGVDLKLFFLRVWKYMWIVVVAALAGAAICAGGYRVFQQIFPEAKEFKAETKYYIDFAEDSTGIGYGYYNDYTWNDLMKSDAILQYTMELLAETEITQEEVEQAVVADIISDVRLLTITVTCSESGRADQIAEATAKSLAHFPEDIKEIDGIRVIRSDAAKEDVVGDAAKNWGLFGFWIGLFAALFGVCLTVCMDSAVYLPKEIEKRFGIPVLGVIYRDEDDGQRNVQKEEKERDKAEADGKRRNAKWEDNRAELAENAGYLLKDKKHIAVVDFGSRKQVKEEQRVKEEKQAATVERIVAEVLPEAAAEIVSDSFAIGQMPDFERLRKADAVIVTFMYGRTSGRLAERYLSDLRKQNCKITCAIICGADKKLYRRYYRR